MLAHARLIVVMGVSGCGKTTVARLLAEQLRSPMLEGDDLHSPENIQKMAAGAALNDADRRDWLAAISQRICAASIAGRALVVSCSALKRRYRDVLRQGDSRVIFVHLVGDKQLIQQRMIRRSGHFMPPALVDSQFDALEVPGADEHAIACDASQSPQAIVSSVLEQLP